MSCSPPRSGLSTYRDIIDEALRIVSSAAKDHILLRVMGALAVNIHCPVYGNMLEKMERVPTDIDFASYARFKDKLANFLPALGYTTDTRLMRFPSYAEGNRQVYHGKTTVDIFFDGLNMCHTIDWSKRLDLDDPTIPLADIVLEKLQIVQINPKDVKDLIVLFLEHEIGNTDRDTVNKKYISELLCKDWGFYYTATTNLQKIAGSVDKYISLPDHELDKVLKRIEGLLQMIEKEPKSLAWKMRSRVGTKKQWYQDVEEMRESRKIE